MRRIVIGVVAVVAAGGVVAAVGMGMAGAASALASDTPPAAVATSFSPTQEAATLGALHDALQSKARAADVPGLTSVSKQLSDELAKLAQTNQSGQAPLSPDGVTTLNKAQDQDNALGQQLALVAHGKSTHAAADGLPDAVTGLVDSVLKILLGLISSVLGGLPAGLPTGLPSLPLPTNLPLPTGLPSLPLPTALPVGG